MFKAKPTGFFPKGGFCFLEYIPLILFSTLFSAILFSLQSCGALENGSPSINSREIWRDMIVKNELEVWSVFGPRKMNEDATVDIGEWASDKPQLLIAADRRGKTYFMAYVIPEELALEVGAQNLEYFYQREKVYIDERTTALSLVIITPPYFWMFSPRALVFAADKIVQHPDFELLVDKIRELNRMYPGTLTEKNAKEIYVIASRIAEDVRNSLEITGLDELMSPRIDTESSNSATATACISEEEFYNRKGIPQLEDADGMKIKFVSRRMVFYGGGFYSSEEPWDPSKLIIQKVFVVKAQSAKIDLSLGNILSLNILNPKVETEVEAPPGLHSVKLYKGFEFSWSIFTEPTKRVGLIANIGRIIKYVVEIVYPNIAACIPDGDTWGWVAATVTNFGLGSQDKQSILSLIKESGAWDEIIRIISSQLWGWVKRLFEKVGLSGCGKGINFVINQLAGFIRNFPLVKLWEAFTKYIPFGWELFTLPNGGAWLVAGGKPIYGIIAIKDINPKKLKSGQSITMDLFGAVCRNCGFEISCPNGSDHIGLGPLFCAESYSLSWPLELWGDCRIRLIQQSSGGTAIVQSVKVSVEKCPEGRDCSGWVDPMEGKKVGVTEKKGCQATPYSFSVIYMLGLLLLFIRTLYEKKKENIYK